MGYGLDKRVLKVFIDCNVLFWRATIVFYQVHAPFEVAFVNVVDLDVPITLRSGAVVYFSSS